MIHTPPRMLILDTADRPVLWTWRHMMRVTRCEWRAAREDNHMSDNLALILISLLILLPVYALARRAWLELLRRWLGSCTFDDYLPGDYGER